MAFIVVQFIAVNGKILVKKEKAISSNSCLTLKIPAPKLNLQTL